MVGSAVIANPGHPALLVYQDECMAWLPRRHLPPHDPVGLRDPIPGVGKQRGVDPQLRRIGRPVVDGVGGQTQEFDSQCLELLAVLQVNYLLEARLSAGPHAEVQEHRFPATELSHGNLAVLDR